MKSNKKSKNNSSVKSVAQYGVLISLAMILSYLENFIPIGELIGLPGVKLGFANIAVLYAIYSMKPIDGLIIGTLRVLLSSLIFSMTMLPYSMAGCVLSFIIMLLVSKTKASIIGVSILGGVFHNIGQMIVAAVITNTYQILFSLYMPFLIIAGLITGFLMGFITKIIINRLSKINIENSKSDS